MAYKALKQNSTIRKISCSNKQPLQKKKKEKSTKTNKQTIIKSIAHFFVTAKTTSLK